MRVGTAAVSARCERCSGLIVLDVDGESSCINCGAYPLTTAEVASVAQQMAWDEERTKTGLLRKRRPAHNGIEI